MIKFLYLFLLSFLLASTARAGDLKVFAAVSLQNALNDIVHVWQAQDPGRTAVLVYAGTPALAKQIIEGAPADIFISADALWMDELARQKAIVPETRFNLASNQLVIIAPADTPVTAPTTPAAALATLADGRLAVADVDVVPAGRYAKAALQSLGLWTQVQDRLARAENVRSALAFVARGEAPLGIVYQSDAVAEPRIKVLAHIPAASHPPIAYPVAQVVGSKSEQAASFLSQLKSAQSKDILKRHGLEVAP